MLKYQILGTELGPTRNEQPKNLQNSYNPKILGFLDLERK